MYTQQSAEHIVSLKGNISPLCVSQIPYLLVFLCLSLSRHISCMIFSFFQLSTRVPPVMVKALAPTSVSSTSTRPSPVLALTSWSCSLTNAPVKVKTDTLTHKHTDLFLFFFSFLSKKNNTPTECVLTTLSYIIQGARNRLFVCVNLFSWLSLLLGCARPPNVTSASLAVISYDRRSDYVSFVCATRPSSALISISFRTKDFHKWCAEVFIYCFVISWVGCMMVLRGSCGNLCACVSV